MASPGLSATIEPIYVERDDDLTFVIERIRASLALHVDRAVAAAGPAVTRRPGFRQAVEDAVLKQCLDSITSVVHANVSVGGRRPGGDPNDVAGDMEPYDETLNRNVMAYQDQVEQLMLSATLKRKTAPPKAAAQVERALANARQAALDRSKAEDWPDIDVEQLVLVNAEMPDGAAGRKDLLDTTAALRSVVQSIERTTKDAERAIEVADDVRRLQISR